MKIQTKTNPLRWCVEWIGNFVLWLIFIVLLQFWNMSKKHKRRKHKPQKQHPKKKSAATNVEKETRREPVAVMENVKHKSTSVNRRVLLML
jgi:Na+-transporting methylmalonyl-CoA/oxaloacetate decarboxylase gamma subunit